MFPDCDANCLEVNDEPEACWIDCNMVDVSLSEMFESHCIIYVPSQGFHSTVIANRLFNQLIDAGILVMPKVPDEEGIDEMCR